MKLTSAEAQELIERDLAHWLARHANEPRPVVFAPPRETLTLCFYGGLRGIGTFATENNAGFGAALMMAGAQTMEEVGRPRWAPASLIWSFLLGSIFR